MRLVRTTNSHQVLGGWGAGKGWHTVGGGLPEVGIVTGVLKGEQELTGWRTGRGIKKASVKGQGQEQRVLLTGLRSGPG